MKAKMVSINAEAVKRALEASGKTARNASLSMGRSESYLFAAMKNGKITQTMLPVLAAALDVPQKRAPPRIACQAPGSAQGGAQGGSRGLLDQH